MVDMAFFFICFGVVAGPISDIILCFCVFGGARDLALFMEQVRYLTVVPGSQFDNLFIVVCVPIHNFLVLPQ